MTKKCIGTNAFTGLPVEVTFDKDILSVESVASAPAGTFVAPGFIDLQVNGYVGVDFNSPTATIEELGRSMRAQYATGVTCCYPTLITNDAEVMLACARKLAEAKRQMPEGAAMEGIHVEGPHLSPHDGARGAHPRQWIRPPDVGLLQRFQDASGGLVRMVTLSPEWPEAPEYIRAAVRQGIVVCIGHMTANAAQIAAAVDAGASVSTHLGNGSHPMLPRHPNYIWDQLAEDRLTAGFIADGHHVPAAFLKAAFRAKGPHRRFVVTDMVWPAGSKPGRYQIVDKEVELTPDDRIVLVGKSSEERILAGSGLPMHKQVANLMRLAGLTLAEAVTMATVDPARTAGIAGRVAGLKPSQRADLVEFQFNPAGPTLEVQRVFVGGELVYDRQRLSSAA